MYLLDTDVVIWHLRSRNDIVALITRLSERGRLGISALTRLEVSTGMKEKERKVTREFLDSVITHEVNAEVADMAGGFIRFYRAQGTTLDIVDAVIAATSVVNDLTLVTLNARHYPMPEVKLLGIGNK
jgi:hypothetical protein